ncbi:hypothetical protein LTS15_002081 [Exophiala xenobiotica]|nr:hypothetical protein LTS15_002081 [Exophiala xenobiotica]
MESHKKYGLLVRIAPNEICVASPARSNRSMFRKAEWYHVLQGGRKFDLFAEQDVAIHASQRRLVSRIYAMETLKDLEPYVDTTVFRFVERMREHRGVSIDMGKWLQLFAFGKKPPFGVPARKLCSSSQM